MGYLARTSRVAALSAFTPLLALIAAVGLACGDDSAATSAGSTTTGIAPTTTEGTTTTTTGEPTTSGTESTTDGGSEAGSATTTDGVTTTEGDTTTTTEGDTETTTAGETATTGNVEPGECVITPCGGKVYECGDCEDNDGDGLIDSADTNCWGPCDNNEGGFKGEIPGQGHSPCTAMDCYFDANSGSGDDGCYWSHRCDPSDPNPNGCTYNPNTMIPGSGMNCETAMVTQSEECLDFCGPLTPNGCDCFGCCEIFSGGESHTVYLGTEDAEGNGSCSLADAGDPTKCAPCVQVEACLSACDPNKCQICIGMTEVPDGCREASCAPGVQSCDPNNNSADCPDGQFCLTGCCSLIPL